MKLDADTRAGREAEAGPPPVEVRRPISARLQAASQLVATAVTAARGARLGVVACGALLGVVARGALLGVVVPMLLAACGAPERGLDGSPASTVTTEGETTTVVNESGSVWGGEATLVEELSIGVEVGADEYMFGSISGIYATGERIWVADSQTPAVRVFDTSGAYVGTIGVPGEGPGEYVNPSMIAVAPAGTVFVYDSRMRRMNAYDREGRSLRSQSVEGAACCAWKMFAASEGSVWMPLVDYGFESGAVETSPGEERYGVQEYGAEGPIGPARWAPSLDYQRFRADWPDAGVPFAPGHVFAVTADGGTVAGWPKSYRFEIDRVDGSRLVVERFWDPVPVQADEAVWYRRWLLLAMNRDERPAWGSEDVEIPDHKPAFEAFIPAVSGEMWLFRAAPSRRLEGDCVEDPLTTDAITARDNSCWQRRFTFDVFDAEGRYLGWTAVPDGFNRFSPQRHLFPLGDRVYAVIEDEAGTIQVKRYRLVPPEEGSR